MAHNKHCSYSDEVHWSLVVEQISIDSSPENTGSSNPELALPYRSTDPGAVKDHTRFVSTSEEWRDQRLMNKLAAICRLPSWSSPLPDPSTTEVASKFKTVNGRYLEFLSLFLTGDRRVDIGFPRRHALGFAITAEEQETVKNLLWPANRQITSVVQLLDAVQDLAERSSYDYCRRNSPQEVSAYQTTTHEHFELNRWYRILSKQEWSQPASEPDTTCYGELKLKLSDCPVRDLRNVAAHRENVFRSAHGYCWEQKIVALIDVGLQYVQILGDKQATAAIEDLKFNVFPHLVQRREESMGPSWCAAID
ncbi:MAG: hypothetical protein Q9228_001451 [Teloschistes exilis]